MAAEFKCDIQRDSRLADLQKKVRELENEKNGIQKALEEALEANEMLLDENQRLASENDQLRAGIGIHPGEEADKGVFYLLPYQDPGLVLAQATHVVVKQRTVAERELFCDLPQLKCVEFLKDTVSLEAAVFFRCSDIEVKIHNRNCQINQQVFFETKVTKIIAPAGGSVEEYAFDHGIYFVPMA